MALRISFSLRHTACLARSEAMCSMRAPLILAKASSATSIEKRRPIFISGFAISDAAISFGPTKEAGERIGTRTSWSKTPISLLRERGIRAVEGIADNVGDAVVGHLEVVVPSRHKPPPIEFLCLPLPLRGNRLTVGGEDGHHRGAICIVAGAGRVVVQPLERLGERRGHRDHRDRYRSNAHSIASANASVSVGV